MTRAAFRGRGRPHPPASPRLDQPAPAEVEPDLAPDSYLCDLAVFEPRLAEADTETCDIGGCTFTGGTFGDSRWHRSRWVDSTFTGVDLANTEMVTGSWERLRFTDCRMIGVRLAAASLIDLEFVGCTLSMANLRQATLRRVRLVNCTLIGADLSTARCSDVEFIDCDLSESQWSNPGRLERLRLSNCELQRATGLSQLRGAVIAGCDPVVLAHLFAHDLGIVVQD